MASLPAAPFSPALYCPLETKRTVRLLALWPGKDDDPILCGVYQQSLDSPKPFFALSYTWGSSNVTKPIYCHFAETSTHYVVEMQVTVNLYDALRRLRDPTRMLPWWVDAVCINQADNDEKGHQVGMMREIYSRAGIVHVWLGHLDCAAEASKTIRSAHEFFTPEVRELLHKPYGDTLFQIHCIKLKAEGKPTLLDVDWTPVRKLLELPWWRRKWVIQETVWAQRVLMIFGTERMLYEEMMNLFDRLALFHTQIIPTLETYGQEDLYEDTRYGMACATTMFEFRHLERPILGPIQLLWFLLKTSSFQSSDTRDYIYAVLGLGWQRQDETFDFVPDYSLSAETTFIRFATHFLEQADDPLYLLFYNTNQRRPSVLQLPSWAPDWTRPDLTSKLSRDFTTPDPWFQATLASRPILHVCKSDNILTIRGITLDTVKARVKPTSDWHPDDKMFIDSGLSADYFTNWKIKTWWGECVKLALDVNSSLDEDFHAALLCELHTSKVGSKHRIKDRKFWGTLMSNLLIRNACAVNCGLKGDEAGAKEYITKVAEIEGLLKEALNKFCFPRSFFTTTGGRIGQGPEALRPGDVVCLFYGGCVPYILRPVGDGTFTFVGHCYVQGVMEGEGMELGLKEVDFRLR